MVAHAVAYPLLVLVLRRSHRAVRRGGRGGGDVTFLSFFFSLTSSLSLTSHPKLLPRLLCPAGAVHLGLNLRDGRDEGPPVGSGDSAPHLVQRPDGGGGAPVPGAGQREQPQQGASLDDW